MSGPTCFALIEKRTGYSLRTRIKPGTNVLCHSGPTRIELGVLQVTSTERLEGAKSQLRISGTDCFFLTVQKAGGSDAPVWVNSTTGIETSLLKLISILEDSEQSACQS